MCSLNYQFPIYSADIMLVSWNWPFSRDGAYWLDYKYTLEKGLEQDIQLLYVYQPKG